MIALLKSLYTRYRMFVLYVVFGVLTTAVNVVVYQVCYGNLGINNDISVVIAWLAAVVVAFLTNKPFVFESHDWSFSVTMREGVDFFLCRLGTGVLEVILMHILVTRMQLPGTPMKLLVNIVVIVLNYVASRLIIFPAKKMKK